MEQLTLLPEDSLVNHSLFQGSEEAMQTTDFYGRKCFASFRNHIPDGSFAKMFLESSIWHSTRFWMTWKVKVTKQKRLLFQLAPSTRRTEEIGCGLWRTPSASDSKNGSLPPSQIKRDTLPGQILRESPQASGSLNQEFVIEMMGYPEGWLD